MWKRTVLLTLAALAIPCLASAGPPMAGAAKEHFNRGLTQYKAGNFDEAVVELETALGISQHPDIAYLLGQAERRRGRCDRAIVAYRRFLAENPPPNEVKVAEANITRCEEILAQAKPPPPPAPPPPVEKPTVEKPRELTRSSSVQQVTGITVASAGLVALGVGTGFAIAAVGDMRRVTNAGAAHEAWTQELANAYQAGNDHRTTATVLLSVGAGLVGVGALVFFLDDSPQDKSQKKTTAAVRVSPTFGGAAFMLDFQF